jgi:hypothetical protein
MQNMACSGIMMQLCTKQGVTNPLVTGPHPEGAPHQLDIREESRGGRGALVWMAGKAAALMVTEIGRRKMKV